jgi:hypothetical protein
MDGEKKPTPDELLKTRRAAPPSWNKVVIFASVGAGLVTALLLMTPVDALTPPGPRGTPQLIMGVMALTACLLWAMSPERRYMRFAASALALIVAPVSPLWSIVGAGSSSLPRVHPAAQVALVGLACLCLLLDYRLHRMQYDTESRLARAEETAHGSRQVGELPEVQQKHRIEVEEAAADLESLRKRGKSNGIVAGIIVAATASSAMGVHAFWRRDSDARRDAGADAILDASDAVPHATLDAPEAPDREADSGAGDIGSPPPPDARTTRPRPRDSGPSRDDHDAEERHASPEDIDAAPPGHCSPPSQNGCECEGAAYVEVRYGGGRRVLQGEVTAVLAELGRGRAPLDPGGGPGIADTDGQTFRAEIISVTIKGPDGSTELAAEQCRSIGAYCAMLICRPAFKP